jgi:peroxiredoxin Q/BCP
MLNKGDLLPEFSLLDGNGNMVTSKNWAGQKAVVIFFYPKDETRGCTKEACSFRDAYEDFTAACAEVVGISSDTVQSHEKFAAHHRLPFVLLSDTGGKVRKLFGVKGDLLGLIPGRETFVFGKDGRLLTKFRSQIRVEQHVREALDVLNQQA